MKNSTYDDSFDPLSMSTGQKPSASKKERTNPLEEQLMNQEQNMLKSTGFVIKKAADYNPNASYRSPTVANYQGNVPFGQNSGGMNDSTQNLRAPDERTVSFSHSPTPFGNNSQGPFGHSPQAKEKVLNEEPIPLVEEMGDSATNKMSAYSNILSEEDSLPGEIPRLKTFATIYPSQYPKISAEGSFLITNYKILFKPNQNNFFSENKIKPDYFTIPIGFFLKVEKKSDNKNATSSLMEITCKDGRNFRLKFNSRETERILHVMQSYCFIERKDDFFAYDYCKSDRSLEDKYKGWRVFDIAEEYLRQGLDIEPTREMVNQSGITVNSSNYRFKYIDNSGGRICSTYPPLLVVPSKIKDNVLLRCSQFRARERLPVLTFYLRSNGACMFRSAQSKPGFTSNRSIDDELYLQYLGNPDINENNIGALTSNEFNLQIYDARPLLAAWANKAQGKGYEDTKNYRNCEISFMSIENIHHVREAHKKLTTMCSSSDPNNRKWYANLESSEWLDMISYILAAGSATAQTLLDGKNCLVHCSDGWDRTAQISAVAEICLDPYFRTIEGFEVLLEKEFLSYGFQSQLRHGLVSNKEKEDQRSPIMLQFLDVVHQIVHQFPFAFEFNLKFLQDIAYHLYSNQFGTFLSNCWVEQEKCEVRNKTISLWSFFSSQREEYRNIYYEVIDPSPLKILKPNVALKFMRLWEENYLYYSPLAFPPYELHPEIISFTDYHTVIYKEAKAKADALEKRVKELEAQLAGTTKDGIEDTNTTTTTTNNNNNSNSNENKAQKTEDDIIDI